MALTDNIVSYWKLDGNSNDAVGSNNGSDTSITYSNANGIINNGAGFNGTTSHITIGTSTTLNVGGGAFSLSAWYKPAASNSGPYGILSRRESSGGTHSNAGYTFLYADGPNTKFEIVLKTTAAVATVLQSTGSYATGTFYFVVFTIDGSGNGTIYVNGSADGTHSFTANGYDTGADSINFYIGQGQDDAGGFLANGAVDEVGVWSRALTSAEVTTLYNGGAGLQYPFSTTSPFTPRRTLLGVGI